MQNFGVTNKEHYGMLMVFYGVLICKNDHFLKKKNKYLSVSYRKNEMLQLVICSTL